MLKRLFRGGVTIRDWGSLQTRAFLSAGLYCKYSPPKKHAENQEQPTVGRKTQKKKKIMSLTYLSMGKMNLSIVCSTLCQRCGELSSHTSSSRTTPSQKSTTRPTLLVKQVDTTDPESIRNHPPESDETISIISLAFPTSAALLSTMKKIGK